MERGNSAMGSKEKPGACASNVSHACSSNHRRSKSASDKNLDSQRNGASHSMEKCLSQNQESPSLFRVRKSYGNQGLSDQDSCDTSVNSTLQSRASLKDDTRDLIKEIELLEEEIAKREQHVLSLYRSIFDQCASEPTTAPSSGMVSPLRSKNGIRKHPSIISTSFCSSKKLPLQPSQASDLLKDSVMSNSLPKTKMRYETLLKGNMNLHVGSCVSETMKEKLRSADQNYLARTLKDHLHQCPSKISEEMIRCMAAIYICINKKSEKTRAPFLSRSSTSVVLPRRFGDDSVWSKRSIVEISSLSLNKQSQRASCAINSYRLLVEQLERVDLSKLGSNEKLAFWINIYNSLIMHAYLIYGVPHSSLRRLVLFNKAAYNIGGQIMTANSIEYSILHCRTTRTGRWLETIVANAMRKKCGDEKLFPGPLPNLQPLVFFGLCTGASSDPMLRVYTAKSVTEELESAKKEFLHQNIVIKKSRKVILPKVLHRYAKEVSINGDDLLGWVCGSVDVKLHEAIKRCRESNCRRKASQFIEWLPYDARFSYVIAKDLVDMPCKVQYSQ